MKVTANLSLLRSKLDVAGKAIAKRTTLPVLSMVLLTCESKLQTVTLKSTNLEEGIIATFPAQVAKDGGVCLPFDSFYRIVAGLGDGELTLTLNEKTQTVNLKSRGYDGNLKGIESSEFPVLQKPTSVTHEFTITNGELASALVRTVFSAAPDDARPVLKSVCFNVKKEQLTLASADGFRLSVVNSLKASVPDGVFLVPADYAANILEVAKKTDKDGTVNVSFSASNLSQGYFEWDNLAIIVQLIEGNFPDFTQIVPKSDTYQTGITLKRVDLERAIGLATVFARESSNTVRFSCGENGFVVAAQSAETGDGNDVVEAEVEGEPIEFALNGKFVDEYLKAVSGEKVTIHAITPASPIVFEEVENDSYSHVMMPMHIGK